ncbi:MAG: succinate dehydrogenase, cytochrome b556 subunit [Gammaproteobacteria bacterium]|nr:MAG: succinate dehydrogenase, cytochrome b556 subunit [Gammaproteobacteria bacterium]
MAVQDKRPVNLDIGTIQLPVTAYASILHRVSGAVSFAGAAVLLWMLYASLASEASFTQLQACLTSFWGKLILWGVLSALAYHTAAGIKHLIMDLGIGETLEGGVLAAKITLVSAAALIILAGAWIWL